MGEEERWFWKPGKSWSKRGISRVGDDGGGAVANAGGCKEEVEIGTTCLRCWRNFQANAFKVFETIHSTASKRSKWIGYDVDADVIWGTRTTSFRWAEIRANCVNLRLIYFMRKVNCS